MQGVPLYGANGQPVRNNKVVRDPKSIVHMDKVIPCQACFTKTGVI